MMDSNTSAPVVLRRLHLTYSRSDLAAVSLIGAAVSAWLSVAAGAFSLSALLACEALFFAFYLTGSLFASIPALAAGLSFDLPLRLLVGYALVNTALFALAWVSPLGIVPNFGILFGLALIAFFAAPERTRVRGNSASLCLVLLGLSASSLWCQDSILPRAQQGSMVVFKPWVDGFYHAVHIRMFAASHGLGTIEDWRLAGIPARPYHYGMYMLPALIKQASSIDAYSAFAGILAPVGVFFTSLAAYAFFASAWGAWSGVAAAAALLLLPDGAQQGMQNTFMSYHWLTQISPSATYGLAVLVVGWVFVIQACMRGSRAQLLAGWGFAALVSVYKLHYVVASALLLLLVPALFFRAQVGRKQRALWVAIACPAYAGALAIGQMIPGVPLIRFDGSSVGEILRLIQTFAKPGALRESIVQHVGAKFSLGVNLAIGVPYVLLSILGACLPLLVILVVALRRRTAPLYWLFPLLLIANFLLMFFGLALDQASSTPDELSHRPLLIVYFFVVTWIGGVLGLALTSFSRTVRFASGVIIGSATLLLAVPARFGSGVQTMWAMPEMSPVRVPESVVEAAQYIRVHGDADDVVQDSQFDRIYVLAALSERRSFVAHTLTRMPFRAELIESRTAIVERVMRMQRSRAISAAARAFGFRWFLHERGDRLDWPEEITSKAVLTTGSLTLYEL